MRLTELYTELKDALYSIRKYRYAFKRWPNLLHPQTFNEYILRKKLLDRNPLLTKIADKYAVREYVTERIGAEHLTKLFLVTTNPKEIDFAQLPIPYAIKATHGSRYNYFVTDDKVVDQEEVIQLCHTWLATNYYKVGREWCYKNIVPRIIVEEFIRDDEGKPLHEFKFYCFGGVPTFISVIHDRYTNFKQNVYDIQWNKLPLKFKGQNFEWESPKPHNIDQMYAIAQKLSNGLDFVRIDLYSDNTKVLFGEMTNYPDNGRKIFDPVEYDLIYGKKWAAHLPT